MAAKKMPQRQGRKTRSSQTRRTTAAQLPPTDQTELQQSAAAEDRTRGATGASPLEETAGPTPAEVALPQATVAADPLPPETEFPRPADNPHAIAVEVPPPLATEVPPPVDREAAPVGTPPEAKTTRRRQRTTVHGEPKAPKPSALEAAARVLAETGQAMSCPELIATMAAKGYWSSPKGQTPEATLYAAMLREINVKGAQARFQKTERGKFGLRVQG